MDVLSHLMHASPLTTPAGPQQERHLRKPHENCQGLFGSEHF